MPTMEDVTVVGIGELLWDCFGEDRRPGGAPANVAFHAASLGTRGLVYSRVGADESGDGLLDHLRRHRLDTRWVQRDRRHPTGWVTVDASRPDDPSYTIHEQVAWDHIEFDERLIEKLSPPAAICFGTLAQREPASRSAIQQTLDARSDVVRVYDVNLRPPFFTREIVADSLARCDVLKLNRAEVSTVLEMFDRPKATEEEFARWVMDAWAIRWVCVTRGEDGCVLVSPDGVWREAGRRIEAADAVGAGDAFTAALSCGILCEWPPESITRIANQVGAIVASHSGATPDVRRPYADLLGSMNP